MSRARIAKLSLVLLAAVALIGVAVFASIDQRALTERVVRRVVAESSESLGRDITFESASGRLLPSPRVTIHGVALAGRPGEPPLVEADALLVHLRLWPIVRSLGREIAIDEVAISQPSVQLIRDAEGSWNFEGIGPEESGRQAELTIDRVSMEDGTVRVVDASGPGRESSVALTKLDVRAEDVGRPRATVSARGALASDEQNLTIELAIASGARKPAVSGSIALDDVELARLVDVLPAGITRVIRGGRVDLDADVEPRDDGRYDIRASASLTGARMRGGPARGELRVNARVDPAEPRKFRADLPRIALAGAGIELAGSGAVTSEPRSISFDLAGPRLDLDVLLATLPEREPADEAAPLLPPKMRQQLASTAARGRLRLERVVRGRLELRDVDARARLRGGVLEIEEGEASLYGGRIVASGTRADLRAAVPEWTVRARIEGADLGAMTQQLAGDRALLGRLEGTLDVSGSGAAWEHVSRSVSGSATLGIHDGELTTGDVGARIASSMRDAVALTEIVGGRGDLRALSPASGRTELGDVRLAFRVADGALVLRDALVAELPFGRASVRGRIGLDRSLDLDGTVSVAPEIVSRMIGVELHEPIEVPLAIGGTLRAPTIAPAAPEVIAQQLAATAAREGTRRLQEEVQEEVEDRAGDVLRDLGGQIFRGP